MSETTQYILQGRWAFRDQPSRWVTLATGPSLSELKFIFDGEKEKKTWGNKMFALSINDDEGNLCCYAEI